MGPGTGADARGPASMLELVFKSPIGLRVIWRTRPQTKSKLEAYFFYFHFKRSLGDSRRQVHCMGDTRTQITKILQYMVLRLTGTAEPGINAVMDRFYSYAPVKRQIF